VSVWSISSGIALPGDVPRVQFRNMPSTWLQPWNPLNSEQDRQNLFAELQREVDSIHPLYGLTATAVAYRDDQDDVAFLLKDGRLAVVHLTWIGKQDCSPFPRTDLYAEAEEFKQQRMIPDHLEWTATHHS